MADNPAVDAVPGTSSAAPIAGVKRKAGSNMIEPADKKSKTVSRREPDNPAAPTSRPGGVLALLCNHFGSPFPFATTQLIQVLSTNFSGWFQTIWDSLVTAIYPDSTFEPAGIITQANFVRVCRYLTKAQIDQVYSAVTGRRPTGRIAIPREFEVLKCLTDVINGIGPYSVSSGAFTVVPTPEDHPAQAADQLQTQVTYAILGAFSGLVKAASVRGLIRTSYVSSSNDGTAWWLLSAREASNPGALANDFETVAVLSSFKEWTPADGLLCSIVQRKFDGIIPNYLTGMMWSFDTVTGIPGLRRTFNLDA